LDIEVKPNKTLGDLFLYFLYSFSFAEELIEEAYNTNTQEVIEGDNSFHCDKCGTKQRALKR